MPAPDVIRQLVERYERDRDAYRSPDYNETQLRVEFLNPLFEVLGWDVYNRQGYGHNYKDVIHEAAVVVEGATKAPDYSFGKHRHDRLVHLAEHMLALHRQQPAARTPDAQVRLQRQIDAADRQIDELVYKLYGLTAEEIRIVEQEGGS